MRAVIRPARRYLTRGAGGGELVCPSLADLHALYAQGFLGDEDLVKAEGEREWTPVASFEPLQGVREERRDPRKMALLLAAAAALSLGAWILLRRG